MLTLPLLALLLPQASAVRSGPAIVVMLQEGCPCAKECHLALNALAASCRGKVRFVGLVDGDAEAARGLARAAELRFPVLPDPRKARIRALGAKEALDLRLVGADRRVLARWNGLCRAHVAALVDAVREATGRDVSLDLTPFTVTPKLGCEY